MFFQYRKLFCKLPLNFDTGSPGATQPHPFFKFPTTYYIVMEGIEIEQFARRILIAFYRFELPLFHANLKEKVVGKIKSDYRFFVLSCRYLIVQL